ncbi:formate dehydrogenase subunit gamma [Helicobacter jaachi]|nr:formate dehydrogenase subunit gamma [Helicobacter jaachi]
MKNIILVCALLLGFAYAHEDEEVNFNVNKHIYGTAQIEAMKTWGFGEDRLHSNAPKDDADRGLSIQPLTNGEPIGGIRGTNGFGELFTILQGQYFALIFLLIVIFVPMAFFGHYKIIGKRHYSHDSFLVVFTKYNIIVHWCAAVPFVMLCITGLMMVFGDKLGGGALIRFARDVHGFATLFFAVFGTLMFFMWVKDCLFRIWDIKWMLILGGYLDKVNREIPAHKFNAGQKMWFWVATVGGAFMVFTGAMMFFQYADINTLRLMAILHNVIGFAVVALLITHIYMAVFAIEGAIESILNGKMGEEELSMLHSLYYKDLKAQGKLDSMRVKH